MSAAFIRRDFMSKVVREIAAVVCLFALPMAAQQVNTGMAVQSGQEPTSKSMPDAPKAKSLPEPTNVDYSKPTPLLPNPLARFLSRDVPPPAFTNAPKIEQLIQNGKLMLSLDDAIAIALADNLDIAVARYNLPIADTDILRTKAGGSFLGVNSGVVANTPGGGQGGIGTGVTGAGAGGTTAGAGGAGVGQGGFVGSTSGAGPQPDSFDPLVTGTFALEQSNSPTNFGLLSGLSGTGTIPVATAHTTTGDLTYSQGFSPGTALQVTVNNQRQTTNGAQQTFNPVLSSNFRATIRQHLLQGFGRDLNLRLLRTARNNKMIAEEGFRQQVISTVSQIENIYWDLVNAYEAYKVNERSLALAQKTLSDNQKQVQIGTLAPLDVVRAQSTVATAEQALIASKTNLQLQQLTIKNALTRTLPNDSPVVQAEVIPTDTVLIPDQENLPPVEQLVQLALQNRPDYTQQKITLKNSEINIKGANNGLLPVVDLVAFYGSSSIAGVQNPLGICAAGQSPSTGCTLPGTIATSGLGSAISNLFNSSGPDKGVQINIQIPLGNRVAESVQIRSKLEYRQSQLALKSFENTVTIGIRNDVFTLQNNRASVVAAQKARDLAAQTLDAEQKKYNLGASTYINVLSDERDLAQSESTLVSAMTNYAKARVQLDRDTAQTLDRYNIKIDEAVTGSVKTQPNVPGITPSKTAIQESTTSPDQPPAQQPPAQQPPK